MQASTRAFIKRGGAACAAAAVLLGGSFTVASAAPSNDLAPVPAVSVEATLPSTDSTPSTSSSATPLPEGLAEAVDRDLNLSVEEFNAQGELAAKAADVQTEVAKADPNALVSIAGDTIKVQASPTAAAAAKTAAGTSKVVVTAAPATTKVAAANVDALFADYVSTFGSAKLQSIMVNGNGEFVIRTGDPATVGSANDGSTLKTFAFSAAATPTVSDFAAKYGNVKIETASGPATAYANDVTNGQGYFAASTDFLKGGICSTGWNGFNRDGAPAIISAGHCTFDGVLKDTYLMDPEKAPAVTDDLNSGSPLNPLVPVGTFGFSQFGGLDNSPATGTETNPGNIGTDVSVIDGINPDLNQIAVATDWATPTDLGASGAKVDRVSTAIVGAPICKSGRTTGWTCGNVDAVGVFLVGGIQNPADVADQRAVRGFGSTTMKSDHGDSGGPVISANSAVGITSAGTEDGSWSYTADLETALAATDGYSVKIFLETPVVTTTGTVYREGTISGTVAGAPAGTEVAVTIDGKTVEVPVDAAGKWSVKAPNKFGTFSITAKTKNGFNESETTEASIEVIRETLADPAITAPANAGTVAAPVTTITGTGKAGATVELAGDVEGSAVVGADGTWSFTIPGALEIGEYTVTAKQTLTDWNDSKEVASKFSVALAAPAVTSPSNGQEFAFDQGPAEISGTNVEGAAVTVTLNGTSYEATVVDGTWSVALDAKLVTGKYTVTAVQTVGDDKSLTATSEFSVLAEPKPEPTTPPVTEEPTTPAPSSPAPSDAPTKAPSNNDLANTGASSSMLVLGGVGGLLLLAGSVFLLIRRRNNAA